MDTVLNLTLKHISNVFSCISRGLGFTIILFLTFQYLKSKSNFKSAYYVILNVGYFMDFLLFVNWVIPIERTVYLFLLIVTEWYNIYFTTIWNLMLSLNRCTALVFLVKYDRIWNPVAMFFILILMLASPFADSYALFTSNCTITTASSNITLCLNFRKVYYLQGTIVNAILNGIGILLIAICLCKSASNQYKTQSAYAKNERRLIYQAVFSSLFQLASFALKYLSAINGDYKELFYGFMYASNIVYHFQHLAVMITHFMLSPTFRNAYMEFYFLHYLMPKRNVTKIAAKSGGAKSTTTASAALP